VAVCIATFRRPAALAKLLALLQGENAGDGWQLRRIVVVDSDPACTARDVVAGSAGLPDGRVLYLVAPARGISAARNTCLEHVGDADLVAFIDDDELPRPRWLDRLIACWRRTGADAVLGPVEPLFEVPPPEWVVRGGFFAPLGFAPDSSLNWAYTSNVLVTRTLVDRYRFDDRYGLTGGEDTHFFKHAYLDGHSLAWCTDAVVQEAIPKERMTARWLVRREFRRGATLSLCLLDFDPRRRRRVRRLLHAAVRVTRGAARFLTLGVTGTHQRVRAFREIAFGAGLAAGLARVQLVPYGETGVRLARVPAAPEARTRRAPEELIPAAEVSGDKPSAPSAS
jgi:glycosyltransferase involved in cell wall biosynthesis